LAELPKGRPDEPCFQEWNTYLREAGRLIDEGHEGKFVLIKEEVIVGIFGNRESALTEGARRFLLAPFLIQQIRRVEPILRIRGYNLPCPSSTSPLAKPA
jgi:hypothetical protein